MTVRTDVSSGPSRLRAFLHRFWEGWISHPLWRPRPAHPAPWINASARRVIDENSTFRLCWDLFIVLMIVVTCCLIPFQLSFHQVVLPLGTVAVYIIDSFFWLDILLNFFTTFRQGGEKITDARQITRHYLRGCFAIDLLAVLPLDALFLDQPQLTLAGLPLALILRQLRLLRLVRLFVIFNRWKHQAWGRADYLRLVHFFILFLILMHWIACIWYLIPSLTGRGETSWLAKVPSTDPSTLYIRALYWVVTTVVTVGYGDVTPVNNYEYVFAIMVMLVGAFMYAFIIGNIANLLRNLDAERARYYRRVEAIGAYLDERPIPLRLKSQVRDYYDYLWAHHRGVQETAYFAELPPLFRLELLLFLTQDLLDKVPLFQLSTPVLRNALLLALESHIYAPGIPIAEAGAVGHELFFLSRGKAAILSEDRSEYFGVLEEGDYFGHLSLILGERRTAGVQAMTYCEVLILGQEAFHTIRREHPEFDGVLQQVAAVQSDKFADLLLKGVVL
ncbi:MAG TPA: ion transporter [Candidatus Competibacteraceae bacterium]|nr:ion transporter [Candidatus Competibacteraceae bacterium]HQD57160.1 ion transporter [Candidatus Competibacteraceae bacterium]